MFARSIESYKGHSLPHPIALPESLWTLLKITVDASPSSWFSYPLSGTTPTWRQCIEIAVLHSQTLYSTIHWQCSACTCYVFCLLYCVHGCYIHGMTFCCSGYRIVLSKATINVILWWLLCGYCAIVMLVMNCKLCGNTNNLALLFLDGWHQSHHSTHNMYNPGPCCTCMCHIDHAIAAETGNSGALAQCVSMCCSCTD